MSASSELCEQSGTQAGRLAHLFVCVRTCKRCHRSMVRTHWPGNLCMHSSRRWPRFYRGRKPCNLKSPRRTSSLQTGTGQEFVSVTEHAAERSYGAVQFS